MVLGIVFNSQTASSLLDNLFEADFNNVSVIMKDENVRNVIADDAGPLKGVDSVHLVSTLSGKGLPQKESQQYFQAILKGQVFIAIEADNLSQQSAVEMLEDQKAQFIRIL